MYNKNYYPTPQKVIDLMLEGIDFKNKIVLDPSAGMGAILNAVQYKCKKTYAIEIDDTFQDTLKGRNHTILHSDFLTYSGTHAFDVILMNPPFDNGAKHFLKALQIAKDATDAAFAGVQRAVDAQRKIVQAQLQVAQESVSNLTSIFDTLKSGIDNLYGSTESSTSRCAQH